MKKADKPIIGWREWLTLPALDGARIKAKVDTGARTSALHAFDVKTFQRDGQEMVRFKVHPVQRDAHTTVEAEVPLLESRWIRSSTGHRMHRPVILTPVTLLDQTFDIEITLINRDEMGFRMLLGREAVRRRFVVDPGRSYFGGRPVRKKKVKKRRRRLE